MHPFTASGAAALISLLPFLLPPEPAWAARSSRVKCFHEEVENRNASLPASSYTRPNARPREEYVRLLGPTLDDALKKARVWFDSGGGFGIAGLQTAADGKTEAFVINAQDFWEALEDGRMNPRVVASLATDLDVSLSGLGLKRKSGYGVSGKFTYIDWDAATRRELEKVRTRVLKKVRGIQKAGNFHYLVGFSEDKMPGIAKQADLITDLYGAFFYSADRMRLLDMYYEKLGDDGMAIIRLRDFQGGGVSDRLALGKNRSVDLVDHLIAKFPDVFSRDQYSRDTLIMKRVPGMKSLGLSKIIRKGKVEWVRFSDTQIPAVQWEINRSR